MAGGAGFQGSTEATEDPLGKEAAAAVEAAAMVDTAVETKRRAPKPTSKSSLKTTEGAM